MPRTLNQILYRGDWILEHLAAIHTNQITWHEHAHETHNPRTPGAYDARYDHYDPDLLPRTHVQGPRFYNLIIPAESRINQPEEHHTTTPTWARQLAHALDNIDALNAFDNYIQTLTPNTPPLAYYDQTTQRMVYGRHPRPLLHAIHIASDSL